MNPSKITLLNIDDNTNNLAVLRALFETHLDVNILEATSGEQGLKILLAKEVDLIILDVNMPGLDGFETAELVKERRKTKDIPIIFLSAEQTSIESHEKGYQVGAIDYITKPIDENQIINKIRLYIKLIDITKELRRSNAELENFAHSVSHDLKEPLRTVQSMTGLIVEKYSGTFDEEGETFLSYIEEGARRMTAMINALLEYSRIRTSGRSEENINTLDLVNEVLQSLSVAIEKNKAEITLEGLPDVYSDPQQLKRLFQNLIANALKFHSGNGVEISVKGQRKNNTFEFSVSDNGIGMEAKYFKRIFGKFDRLHTRNEYPGTGMGLAICENIVNYLGGNIWVESEPQKGSTFFFTLPTEGANTD